MIGNFFKDLPLLFYDKPELFHWGVDHVYRCCISEDEHGVFYIFVILFFCGVQYAPRITSFRDLQSGFY